MLFNGQPMTAYGFFDVAGKDYVIASGIDEGGSYRWRKWASGLCEVWKRFEWDFRWYGKSEITKYVPLPVSLSADSHCFVGLRKAAGFEKVTGFIPNASGGYSSSALLNITRAADVGNNEIVNFDVFIYACGRYKEG